MAYKRQVAKEGIKIEFSLSFTYKLNKGAK
jgi:hypothetical protein